MGWKARPSAQFHSSFENKLLASFKSDCFLDLSKTSNASIPRNVIKWTMFTSTSNRPCFCAVRLQVLRVDWRPVSLPNRTWILCLLRQESWSAHVVHVLKSVGWKSQGAIFHIQLEFNFELNIAAAVQTQQTGQIGVLIYTEIVGS